MTNTSGPTTRTTATLSRTTFSRRELLQGMSVVLGAGMTGTTIGRVLLGNTPAYAALGPTLPTGTPVVVVVELAGANDILNTHIPFAVPNTTGYYRNARPNIGITRLTNVRPYTAPPAGDYLPPALDLDGAWALHGALPWLANRWHDRHDVAIVQGVGENVQREMSHFGAMSYRWAGAFTGPLMATGWLGRYNDLANANQPLGAISLAGVHQSLASVNSPSVAIGDLQSFGFYANNVPDGPRWMSDFTSLGDPAPVATNKVATAARSLANANAAVAKAKGVAVLPSSGGSGSLAGQLSTAASLILGGVPCQTYVATLGGFDTHGGEPYNHWERLTALNAGLAHFFSLIDNSPRANDVFVVIQSEFGRQITQNSGIGTDHGLGSSVFVIGGGTRGGLYGEMPSLAPASRYFDALIPTVDFRSVYATVLNRLGHDANLTESALGMNESNTRFSDLGLFTTGPQSPPSTPTAPTTTTQATITTTPMPPTTTPMPPTTTTTTPMPPTTLLPVTPTTTKTAVPTTTRKPTTTTRKPTTTAKRATTSSGMPTATTPTIPL